MNMASEFTLFLVEDNEDDFMLFDDALKREGIVCRVEWYTCSEDALVVLESLPAQRLPHLIISDLDMPGIGGHVFLERIRGNPDLCKIPIMIMTGSAASADREYCALADHYFIKPRTRIEWGVVNALIKRYRSGSQEPSLPDKDDHENRQAALPLVLHVEDHADDRELFAVAFQRSGVAARLSQVCSVEEAHEVFRNDPAVALMILDLSLPGSSGKELLADLRTSTKLRQIPVIILSGSDQFSDVQACRELYMIDYVVKPRSPRQMSEFISTFRQWFNSALAQLLVQSKDA